MNKFEWEKKQEEIRIKQAQYFIQKLNREAQEEFWKAWEKARKRKISDIRFVPVRQKIMAGYIKSVKARIYPFASQKGARSPHPPTRSGFSGRGRTFRNFYISKFAFFSGKVVGKSYRSVKDAVKANFRYITKKGDVELIYNGDWEKWNRLIEEELKIRYDARVACKFFLTLPNDMSAEDALEIIKEYIDKYIQASFYTIAIHRNIGMIEGKENLHAHILFFPRTKDGKKIRFNKNDLRELKIKWKETLQKAGYDIVTAPWRNRKRVNLFYNGGVNLSGIRYIQLERRMWAILDQAIYNEIKDEERKEMKTKEKTSFLQDFLKKALQGMRKKEGVDKKIEKTDEEQAPQKKKKKTWKINLDF